MTDDEENTLEDADIVLDPPKPADDAGKKPDEPKIEVQKAEDTPQDDEDPLAKLKAQLAASEEARALDRTRADAAERRANDLSVTAVSAETAKQQAEIQFLSNAVETAKQQIAMAKSTYAEAAASGDWAAAADAQADISEATNNRSMLERGLVALKAQPAPRAQPSTDPVERLIRDAQLPPKAAAWLRSHPEYATDPGLNRKLVNAAGFVEADGVAPETPEYFARVEGMLGLKQPNAPEHHDDALSEASRAMGNRTPPAAAPVSRGNGNPGSARPGTVRLTAAERETAHFSFPTETPAEAERQYAFQKIRIEQKKNQIQ